MDTGQHHHPDNSKFQTAPPLPGTGSEVPHGGLKHPRRPSSAADQERHLRSVARYPELSLSPGEYVIEVVNRHPIGLLTIWFITGFLVVVMLSLLPLYSVNQPMIADLFLMKESSLPSAATLTTPALILSAFFVLGGIIATIVYNGNRFYLTNESVIQHVQFSLFSTKQQVVNLINVEDASSTQRNILEQILNYGTLRLSTQGEETTYEFRFVANPKRVVNVINTATENAVRQLEGGVPPTEF